jgi:thiol-disulfide isomerase/thioredoxin
MKIDKSHKNDARQSHTSFWTPTRILVTFVTLCLLVAVGASSCNSADETAKVKPLRADSTAANPEPTLPSSVREAEMPSVNGSVIKLADYSGKVVLVNLWATWCGPCRLEIPELVKLHQEYRSKGLEMVGLSTENPEASAEMVRDFVREYNVDYPIGWATREVALSFMQLSGRNAIPQSFIIAPDGRILNQFVGFNAVQTPDKLRQAIEAALTTNKAD